MAEPVVLAHWYQPFDTFSMSTQEFYKRLTVEIERRHMPEVELLRSSLPQGGMLQGKRDYLRVNRGKLTFMLCAAPFGIDFFVSWWLLEEPGCLSGCLMAFMPWVAAFTRRSTFYEEDTAAVSATMGKRRNLTVWSVEKMLKAGVDVVDEGGVG